MGNIGSYVNITSERRRHQAKLERMSHSPDSIACEAPNLGVEQNGAILAGCAT
jgi:hypothetical protein